MAAVGKHFGILGCCVFSWLLFLVFAVFSWLKSKSTPPLNFEKQKKQAGFLGHPHLTAKQILEKFIAPLPTSSKDWAGDALRLLRAVLPQSGWRPLAVSRVPYLTGGDEVTWRKRIDTRKG